MITLADGGFIAAWTLGSSITAWRFDRQGNMAANPIVVTEGGNPSQLVLLPLPAGARRILGQSYVQRSR